MMSLSRRGPLQFRLSHHTGFPKTKRLRSMVIDIYRAGWYALTEQARWKPILYI